MSVYTHSTFRLIRWLLAVAVTGFCTWAGQTIPFSQQWPLFQGLQQTAGIVFGVIGVWIAIVNPRELRKVFGSMVSDKMERETAKFEYKRFQRLLMSMRYSTGVLLIIILVGLFAPIARQVPWLVQHKEIARGLSYGLLGLLAALEIWAILLAVVPGEEYDYHMTRERKRTKHARAMQPREPEPQKSPRWD